MKKITSEQNPGFKAAMRLKTSRGRKTQQRYVIFGVRELLRAMTANVQLVEVFVCSESVDEQDWQRVSEALPDSVEVYDLAAGLMQQLQYGDRDEGVVGVAQRPDLELDRLKLEPNSLVVVLESLEKPGNVGAVLRSLDGAGANALILADPQCDVFHPNCIRSSMGSVFTMPVAIGSSDEVVEWCATRQMNLFAAMDSAKIVYTDVDLTGPTALVFGNEARGLSSIWQENKQLGNRSICQVSIPMKGISDSLNVSVASAVMMYEAVRQRA